MSDDLKPPFDPDVQPMDDGPGGHPIPPLCDQCQKRPCICLKPDG